MTTKLTDDCGRVHHFHTFDGRQSYLGPCGFYFFVRERRLTDFGSVNLPLAVIIHAPAYFFLTNGASLSTLQGVVVVAVVVFGQQILALYREVPSQCICFRGQVDDRSRVRDFVPW